MRFLNVKTLKLHSFEDASAYPPYAILSHCWYSSEQELTFKDFEDLSQHTSKPGYSKIVNACHAAVTQGYMWLWADSVCINAEDTLEKEETVKSLYSMFSKAGVCLLYLSEIPNANIKDDDKEILSSAAQKSRWASGAWTYRELIPPNKSVFYAADWSRLDPEFQAEMNTNIIGVNQYNGSKEERKHSYFPSHPPRVQSSQRQSRPVYAATEEQIQAAENPTPTPTPSPPPGVIEPQRRSNASQSRPVYGPLAATEEQIQAAENPTPTTTPPPSPPPGVIEPQRRSNASQSRPVYGPLAATEEQIQAAENPTPTTTPPPSPPPGVIEPQRRSNASQSRPVYGPLAATEEQIQAAENPTPTTTPPPSPPPGVIEPQRRSNASQSKQPSTTTDGSTLRNSGPTGTGPLSSFENFSSAPTVDEAERSTIADAGRNLNITQNGALDKSTWGYSYTVKYRRGLSHNYGDDSNGDPVDPQANSRSVIKILILDNDHAVRNTLATLLKRLIPAQVTVDSGDVVNFEKSGYDIVFARGEGTLLLHMPPNHCRQGAILMPKRPLFAPNPSSSAQKISLQEHGTHQVICEFQKQKFIEKLVSFVPGVEQDNENDCIGKFNVFLMWSIDLASCSSEQESVGQDQLLGHPTIDSVTSDLFCDQQAMAHVQDDYRYRVYLIPMKDTGPANSCHHNPTLVNIQSPHEHGSVQSDAITNSLYSSTIEFKNQSHGTPPSTVPTSMPHQPQNPKRILGSLQTTECQTEEEEGIPSSHHKERQNQWSPRKSEKNCAEFDAATTYSFDTLSDDPQLQYFQAFIDQLAEDVSSDAQCTTIKNVGPEFLEETLREFAWRLHGESTNTFQLETSVIIHRKRRHIVDLLELQVPAFETAESESGHSFMSSGNADYEDESPTKPFRKPEEMIVDWIGDIGSGEPNGLSQIPQYRQFILGSEAYQWLLTNISQQSRLSCEVPSLMNRIGATIRSILKEHIPQHKMSRKQACIDFEMTYSLTLDIIGMMKRSGISSSFGKALTNILCLTGKCDEAQATSVAEYMAQTWPQSGGAIISLMQALLSDQESFFSRVSPKAVQSSTRTAPNWPGTTRENYSNHCFLKGSMHKGRNRDVRYEITARGGYYAVSEVGEQIAWLASVFREHKHTGFISIMPRVTDFSATALNDKGGSTTSVMGKCRFSFSEIPETAYNPKQGFCWERLFSSLNIVRGYPILRRSVPNPGLEVSLQYAASIVGSSEVVQWGSRLVIKGFNMLMVATQATADVVVWHLLVSQKPEERISYVDPRLDHIDIKSSEEISLRHIEGKRHIIGWCTKATDLCGHHTANHEIKPGGLPKSSASIVVDKLYIEGGSPVTAGVMLDVNKKEQPFWLQREKDYPSLLNWVKLQPVIFYDVEERRAWLVDGASALLHLVRISLHLDINDPESAYDWVYDPSKLKDHWPGVGSRQAALQTLKNWENRALNVYIVDKHMDSNGVPATKYSTFEERVKRILHSVEKLIDRQAQAASQDGIKISQTLDPRRDVVGFDIVDVIDPAVPIYPRIQHLNSWGHGWIDLIPTVGITALFGRGFGDLIRADEPDLICPSWRSVPAGKDYLAASISTMQMLHEKRLLRMEPGLIGGELTKKITWVAAKEASSYCKCLKGQASSVVQTAGSECNHNPVQFLAKKWWSRTIPHGLKPVHLGSLDAEGAVIFGHTVLGLRTGDRSTSRQADDDGEASMTSGEQAQDASVTGSIVSQTTSITVPSVGHSSHDAESAQESLDGTSNATAEGKKKRWSKFKNWVKR